MPPEINSVLMFAGAGSEPMLLAARGWSELSAELQSAAAGFASLTSGLTGQFWQGAAAQAMTGVAQAYAAHLSATAAQAGQVSAQANGVAAVFDAARAAIVHPLQVAANRTQLVSLVVSNLFGQNAPAIAAVEANYEEMWAQDVSAMSGYYTGASAAVAQLTPWELTSEGIVIPLPDNIGVLNFTPGNIGSLNLGIGNVGDLNLGSGNTGAGNLGLGNFGELNLGSGNGNSGNGDSTTPLSASFNLGSGNLGDANPGSGNLACSTWAVGTRATQTSASATSAT